MIFTNTITLILALAPAALFAAPTPTSESLVNIIAARSLSAQALKALEDGACDLARASMPIGKFPLQYHLYPTSSNILS